MYLRHQKQMQFRINLFVRSASISCHVAKATVESILCCEIEIHVSLVLDIKELKKKRSYDGEIVHLNITKLNS